MKIHVLIALMSLWSLAHAEPAKNDLALKSVQTTASGGIRLEVSFKLQNAVLEAQTLEPGQSTTLREGVFFATIRSVKALAARDNVVTVQLTAAGYEGINGSRLTALYVLEMQQGNEYAISNFNQRPIFDSTANVERDLSNYLIGMTQPSLANCSEVDALRVLVAYQRKFPTRLLKMAMNDAEGGKFKKASGGGLCAQLPEAEADVDISLREPALPAPKKTPPTVVSSPDDDSKLPAPPKKKSPRPAAPAVDTAQAVDDDDDSHLPAPPPNPGRGGRAKSAPAPRRAPRDPYDRGGYDRSGYGQPQGYGDPYGQGGYGGRGSYGNPGGYGGY